MTERGDVDPDAETTEAIKALAWRLGNRSADTDPETVAREYVFALRRRGWRPTRARPLPGVPGAHEGRPSERVSEHAESARTELARRGVSPIAGSSRPVNAWCTTCGCIPRLHTVEGGCSQCVDCQQYATAAPPEVPESGGESVPLWGAPSPQDTPSDWDQFPGRPNTNDDSYSHLRKTGAGRGRRVETVELPDLENQEDA